MRSRTRTILVGVVATAVAVGGLTVAAASPPATIAGAMPAASATDEQAIGTVDVVIGGFSVGLFAHVMSITTTVPGEGAAPPAIVLRRTFGPLDQVHTWHEQAATGDPAGRQDFSVVLYAEDGSVSARYFVENGWPSVIRVSKGAAFETVTFTGEHVLRIAD